MASMVPPSVSSSLIQKGEKPFDFFQDTTEFSGYAHTPNRPPNHRHFETLSLEVRYFLLK